MLSRNLLPLVIVMAACGGPPRSTATPAGPAASCPPAQDGYAAALATELGADEYEMHAYVNAFLKAGPKRDQPEAEAKALMKAHLANIERMANEGTLVLAGPFLDDGSLRGIYVFKVATVEEARALTATDPAIQAGRLEMELHPWYGSAALQQLNTLHKRVQRKSFAD